MRIDSNDLNLSLTAKRNAVIAAQAAFVQAQADEKRFSILVKSNAASTQQYERAKLSLDTAAAQLAAARADATVAENEVAYTVLLADCRRYNRLKPSRNRARSYLQAACRSAGEAGPREALVWMRENLRPAIGEKARATI